jgi:hypothetical protein
MKYAYLVCVRYILELQHLDLFILGVSLTALPGCHIGILLDFLKIIVTAIISLVIKC